MLNKKYTLIIVGFFLVVTLGLVTPYTAPTYNDVNFSLCSGYTPPNYNSINFTLSLSDSCITDTCTYSGSGDWNITMSDYCVLNTNTDITTNDIIFYGAGNCTINTTINVGNIIQPVNNGIVYIDSNARLIVG
jgi:hypothetical protein